MRTLARNRDLFLAAACLIVLAAMGGAILVWRHARSNDDLIRAVRAGNVAKAQALLQAGADANATDVTGDTVLMMAAQLKPTFHYETRIVGEHVVSRAIAITDAGAIVRLLLDHGARPGARNPNGRTALQIARERRNGGVAALLEQELQLVGARE